MITVNVRLVRNSVRRQPRKTANSKCGARIGGETAGKGRSPGGPPASPEAGIIFDGTRVLASALQQNDQLANGHQGQRTSSMSQHHQQQMTFAQIGTLYNTISNEL